MSEKYIPQIHKLERLKNAISNSIALDQDEWLSNKSSSGSLYQLDILYARVVFVQQCRSMGIGVKALGGLIGVNYSTICYYGKRYADLSIDSRFLAFENTVKQSLSNI